MFEIKPRSMELCAAARQIINPEVNSIIVEETGRTFHLDDEYTNKWPYYRYHGVPGRGVLEEVRIPGTCALGLSTPDGTMVAPRMN